jgi:hypothetical protein
LNLAVLASVVVKLSAILMETATGDYVVPVPVEEIFVHDFKANHNQYYWYVTKNLNG